MDNPMTIIEKAREFVFIFGEKEISIEDFYEQHISEREMSSGNRYGKAIPYYNNENAIKAIAKLKVI